MLKRLLALDAMPARYAILEPSADLRERQRERLGRGLIPPVFDRIEWLEGPPEAEWNGVLFANEVIDALPTPRFTLRDGEVFEENVALGGEGRFIRSDRPADALLAAAARHVERYLGAPFPDGYRSELLPQLPYWMQAVMGGLRAGAMLFVDYGYPRREYYLPQRDQGTLRAFYRHRVHDDAFAWPGLQDLTASVDFTALAEAGTQAGFELEGYCTQASFLLGNGLPKLLEEAETRADEARMQRLRNEAKRLTLPSEMGERFQVMGFSRDVEFGTAFLAGDLTWRLSTEAAATSVAMAWPVVAGHCDSDRCLPDARRGPAANAPQHGQDRACIGVLRAGRRRSATVQARPGAAGCSRGTGAAGRGHRIRPGRIHRRPQRRSAWMRWPIRSACCSALRPWLPRGVMCCCGCRAA